MRLVWSASTVVHFLCSTNQRNRLKLFNKESKIHREAVEIDSEILGDLNVKHVFNQAVAVSYYQLSTHVERAKHCVFLFPRSYRHFRKALRSYSVKSEEFRTFWQENSPENQHLMESTGGNVYQFLQQTKPNYVMISNSECALTLDKFSCEVAQVL